MKIEEKISNQGERLGKTEKKVIEYLIGENREVSIGEIIREIYGIEEDKSSKEAMRTMISRINYKIRRTGVKIVNERKKGYEVKENEKYKRRGKIKNHYKDIEKISEEKLREIIKNLRR